MKIKSNFLKREYKKRHSAIWSDKHSIVGNSVMINVINSKSHIKLYKTRPNGIEEISGIFLLCM